MVFEELKAYRSDLKALSKKYRSLEDDLEILKKVLRVQPDQRPPFSFRIGDIGITDCIIKVKKIACKSLKGRGVNSGLRLVYAWYEKEARIVFVEIYHKSDKETEDRDRILLHFS
jgi:mRNA-degrading endonuclease RelE of RelBE toxin-antitoxin system